MSLLDLVRTGIRGERAYQVGGGNTPVIKLDANEHSFPLDDDLREEVARAVAAVDFHRYPRGDAPELRAAIAADLGCRGAELVFGNGSDELLHLLCATFAQPRAGQDAPRIAYPVPSFAVYRAAAVAAGAVPVEIPLRDDFTIDLDATCRRIAEERPNLIFLSLPNNPTGTLWPRSDVTTLAARFPDMIVVADEAYLDYAGDTVRDLVPGTANIVLLRTLSKLGLAALRIGFMFADESLCREVDKIRPPYNLGTLNQVAALVLLGKRARLAERVRQILAERDRLATALAALPRTQVFPSRANFLLFRHGAPGDAHALAGRLAARGIVVRDFDKPGPLAACLRVTVGTPTENDRFLEAVAAETAG